MTPDSDSTQKNTPRLLEPDSEVWTVLVLTVLVLTLTVLVLTYCGVRTDAIRTHRVQTDRVQTGSSILVGNSTKFKPRIQILNEKLPLDPDSEVWTVLVLTVLGLMRN